MNSDHQQFETSKRRYLEQKFPGDLADVLDPTDEKTERRKKSGPPLRPNRYLVVAIAASLLIGLAIGLPYLLSPPDSDKTAKSKSPVKRKIKLVHLSKPVSLSFSTKQAKSTVGFEKPRSKTLWTASFKSKSKSKTKRKTRQKTFWLSFPNTSQKKIKSQIAKRKKQTKPKFKTKFRNDFRFQPTRILKYRRT